MSNPYDFLTQSISLILLSITGNFFSIPEVHAQNFRDPTDKLHPHQLIKTHSLIAQLNEEIKFKIGANSATIKGGVARGTVNTYTLGAKEGQTIDLEIQSVEGNAIFTILTPEGKMLVTEQKSWSGKLPTSGTYQIIIGTERGGASYTLSVRIK